MIKTKRPPRVKEPKSHLSALQLSAIEDYIKFSVPEKHKIATERALKGQMARANAIKMRCLQCCNYDREEVKHCPVITCALNIVRPYQSKDEDLEDEGGEV